MKHRVEVVVAQQKSAQQSSSGLQRIECSGSAWSPTSSTTARQHDVTVVVVVVVVVVDVVYIISIMLKLSKTSS